MEQGSTSSPTWSLPLAEADEDTFIETVEAVFTEIYNDTFAKEPLLVNHALPIQVRALRSIDPWRVGLLLTPWMLARLFSPLQPRPMLLPAGWSATERAEAPYAVIGPLISFSLLEESQKAHLNYHPRLGHYLVQPLVQAMEGYDSATAVYQAWDRVIERRRENMRRLNKRSAWHEELSRRELFAKFRRRASKVDDPQSP